MDLKIILQDFKNKLQLLIGFGTAKRIKDQGREFQLERFQGEIKDGIKRIENYGFASFPMLGARALVLFPGGDQSGGVIVAAENEQLRFGALKEGETAVYTDQDFIHLKRGEIEIKSTKKVVIKNGNEIFCTFDGENKKLIFNGDLEVSGTIKDHRGNLDQLRDKYNSHGHNLDGSKSRALPTEEKVG
ncbi:MAG: phage baseplate assembly protein [Oligoflexia bacterium]|nr:phage baseplate assembly protein [Oligoflexia bacterium]